MKTNSANLFRSLLSAFVLCCYVSLMIGCSGSPSSSETASSEASDHDDHDHDHDDHDHDDHDHDDHDHDHDDHEGHDHAAHGPNGGHMVELTGGGHAEWLHNDQKDEILVYLEDVDSVDKVEMKVTIEGEETVYAFEPVEGEAHYRIVSPDLLFAVKMGESVKTDLVVTHSEGEATGAVKHHAH